MNRSITRWLLLVIVLMSVSAASFGQIAIGIGVRIGPPALPIYAQPMCPGPGYYWTPGYWGWNDEGGYYWVPGTWVVAPVGMLWTPGYWGWGGGFYAWHGGYWGPHIGFYGGINYGFGYGGVGFVGGEWRGGGFYYNRAVANVSVTNVTNVYNKTVVVNNTTVNNVSYNGGTGGVTAQPTAAEQAAEHEQHTAPLAAQTQHEQLASQNKQNFASVNNGKPAIAATSKAGDFSSRSAIPARAAGAEYHAPAMSPKEARVSTPGNMNNAKGSTSGSPQEKSNNGFRSFTPPNSNKAQNNNSQNNNWQNKGAQTNPMYKDNKNSGTNPLYESKDKAASAPASNPPKSNYHPAPQSQHKSSPPPPPPHHSNPPKEEHHKGR
ncbi:MAG TPA: YXWGXW repeat-containing protein [Candidatus Sulfotelmatobacter sp.]|nr:YXWGXW repeat-containing protein [Candidatus Sulfotelmatobacter sp.]